MKACRPFLLILVATTLLIGCTQSDTSSRAGTGMLKVMFIDAPIDLSTVQSVNVTLTGVIVYPKESTDPMGTVLEGSPISLLTFPATFDLLTLTGGATALLASGEVPAGTYSRIRLEVSEATMINTDGTTTPLMIESNKVDVPIRFEVGVDATSIVTLDFDAAASVQVNSTGSGMFILRPVVTPVQ